VFYVEVPRADRGDVRGLEATGLQANK